MSQTIRKTTTLPITERPEAPGNFDTTRTTIDKIIIHTEVGFREGTASTFNNPLSHVTAHYGVNMDGSIDHFVDEMYTAYHAGNYFVNQSSIGIEHEDFAKPNEPRTDELYHSSALLVYDICKFYGIPVDRARILKHSEVSTRGTACPDALDVDRIVKEAKALDLPAPLQPPPPVNNAQAIQDQLRQERDSNWKLYEEQAEVVKARDERIHELERVVSERDETVRKINVQLKEVLVQNTNIATELANKNKQDAEAIDMSLKYQDDLKEKNRILEETAVVLKTKPKLPNLLSAIDDLMRNQKKAKDTVDALSGFLSILHIGKRKAGETK